MKLTPENIQFIDNYLEHSGINYLDIRVEMVDHIASAMESEDGDFYDTFKAYMLAHKSGLLARYGMFKKAAFNKGVTVLKNNIISIWFIAAVVLLYLLRYPAAGYLDDVAIINAYRIVSFTAFVVFMVIVTYYRLLSKWSFSIIEQAFGIFILLDFINVRPLIRGLVPQTIHDSIAIVFTVAATISLNKIYRRYKKVYAQYAKLS